MVFLWVILIIAKLKSMKDLSYISNAHPAYIENLYQVYLKNPQEVDQGWMRFFEGFELGKQNELVSDSAKIDPKLNEKELAVMSLIDGFRHRGHLLSETNPIRQRRDRKPHLQLSDFNLSESDLKSHFAAGQLIGLTNASLEQIIDHLNNIYCQHIGYEYSHIDHHERRMWLRNKIESNSQVTQFGLSIEQKKRILSKLNDAVVFEKFLHTKYVGQKRFSLEGGEATIAALDALIQFCEADIVEEIIIGMAHRGRLNVLANIMGKTYEQIFNEFEGNAEPQLSFGSGDVKYHLGYSSQIECASGKQIQLKLAPNPSHLEAVNPVVEGLARAKADILYNSDYDKILPVLIHGDAAVAGQGIVYELVQMSQLKGYYTGGTIHLVINNQIGFTTDFDDARSSTYCTAAASIVQAPVFHVNGDDPEAVVHVMKLAFQYRQEFNSDVFIDMVCYRRHGHNEGDDPKFTQPEMYDIISQHQNVRELYIQTLSSRGDLEAQLAKEMEKSFWNLLQDRLDMVKQKSLPYAYQAPEQAWRALQKHAEEKDFEVSPTTGISIEDLQHIIHCSLTAPEYFNVLPKINRLLKSWKESAENGKIDWSLAESIAFGSLLMQGKNVRMSGQDVKRGTFSHRHAILFDEQNNTEYDRLSRLKDPQGKFFIYNSLLSEFAVLGFEYGYSLASPDHLVLWEAQFGDFSNGAQVVFDQFLCSAESKWNRMSGLVVLLPHGYDGQGPEHSSARLERFLQSAAEYNFVVCNVSTPANYFHMLRRQLQWNFRKPLILMSPKSLLRHPRCFSSLDEFVASSKFQEIIVDHPKDSKNIKKLILCSGQVYYDILNRIETEKISDSIVIRIEQLYPFPMKAIQAQINKFSKAQLIYAQEEPQNMGAAMYVKQQLGERDVKIISRKASASPAVGFKKIHDQELKSILNELFQ